MTSSIEYQPPQYNSNPNDSRTLDHEETILGHLLTEKQYSLKDSLYYLTSYAKEESKTWDDTETIASGGFWVSLVAAGTAMVAMGSGPLGLTVGGVVAAIGAGSSWILKDTAEAVGKLRRTEFELHRHHPWIRDRLWEMSQQGATAAELVAIYDRMVFGLHANGIPADGNAIAGSMQMQAIAPMGAGADDIAKQRQIEYNGFDNGRSPSASDGLFGPHPSSATAQTELQPQTAAAPSMSSAAIEPRDIATDLGNNPQSALVFGTPGAGKGMNISNAIRAFRAKYPNVRIMMVDPKGDPKERGYWESQVDIFESKPILKAHPRSAAEWMLECIDDFRRMDSPKLLIWDELYATVTVLKSQHSPRAPKDEEPFPCLTDFQSFLATHLSLGPSSGIWVWGMSQSANLTDLGLTSGGLSTTRIIALVSPDNTGAIEGLYATKAITAPKGGMETIESLMEASPVGRACYDGKTKRWYPMARLENHSGFDRDNADWNNLGKSSPAQGHRLSDKSEELLARFDRLKEMHDERMDAGTHYEIDGKLDWEKQNCIDSLNRSLNSAIEVEAAAVVERPDGLDDYPLVATVWDYLDGKDPRSLKQISDAMKAKGKIPEDVLKSKIPNYDNYKEGIKTVLLFGVNQGYLKQISEDAYEAIRKQ